MSTSPSVLSAERRVWQYWYADGLPVLVAGAGCLAMALPFLVIQTHSLAETLKILLLCLALLLYAVLLLGQRQMVAWLKAKLTYPRSGYVLEPFDRNEPEHLTILSLGELDDEPLPERETARRESKRRATFAIVLVIAAVLASAFLNSRPSVLIAGVLMSLALWVGSRKEIRLPWPALAVFPLVGLYLTLNPVDGARVTDQLVYLWFGAGLTLILLGLAMFLRYLVAYRAAKSDQQ